MVKSIELSSVSVVGGWQSAIKNTPYVFGPIFRHVQDLWAWQRANIYGVQ
jgi:hypothetical protein